MPADEETVSNQPDIYPGPLAIWKNANLTPTERRIEQRFAEQLQHNLSFWLYEYRYRHGRILDTDLARGLSDAWNHDNESRARYTSAVHNPASALIHALFYQMLAEAKEKDRDIV